MGHRLGKRIMLREYRREDLPEMRKWVNDDAVTRFLSHTFLSTQTLPMTESFLDRVLDGRSLDYNFVIADRDTENYIGQVDLINLNSLDRCAELGIVIGDSEYQSQGFGTEAIGLVLEFAFLRANLQRVELWVNADNARALRCYEKAGFVWEGCRRQCHFHEGRYIDLMLMGVLREEWLAARGASAREPQD